MQNVTVTVQNRSGATTGSRSPTCGCISKRTERKNSGICIPISSSFIYDNQKMETTQESISVGMYKNVVPTFGYYPVFKKEGNFDTCYNTDEP
jgi:hypothetical protein